MQGGKNWILPKEIKMQSVSSETLIGWKLEKQHMSPEAVRHEREIANAGR
jgi:hypothetical protein